MVERPDEPDLSAPEDDPPPRNPVPEDMPTDPPLRPGRLPELEDTT